ncbi:MULTISPECIES: Fur family transcriptional regulator [Tissierellales]|jgi:Fur family peroxide stress response transcriptional regulator|uniref:Transcriptional repressor n=1 Tax=Acidilutibacter cellobiosedens TaxID=2507161 RepID=A0A410Q9S6_9FIRM|nr:MULTISPECIES: Fur family transcriptional regulator [Tissierellales]MBE6083137.1 transcriptional repressor [Tissierellaceae bacterium]QAT60745.1 transcriptional repressor [Acidilutibacter cellobiosedens]SCL87471.1 Peroxide operon regulator [Sporanaerobacter sp. PP17-6a]
MKQNTEQIKKYLKEHNIKPSTIRIKVFDFLLNNRIHPTIDEIYNNLINEIPTLSKTSIYNTMELFLKNNIVKLIKIDEKETRYDIDTSLHGHFKCESCGKIYDFKIEGKDLNEKGIEGFKINSKNIYYYGLCNKCIEEKNNNN